MLIHKKLIVLKLKHRCIHRYKLKAANHKLLKHHQNFKREVEISNRGLIDIV